MIAAFVLPCHLRAATADDLDAMWDLEARTFGDDAWSKPLMREELTGDHREYLVLVDAADRLCGYGGLFAIGTEGDIQTIAVAEELRGHGYGRKLMEALLGAAHRRGVDAVFLEVRADNPVAQRLYESLGFIEIAVRPRYYQPDDVDAIVMRAEVRNAE